VRAEQEALAAVVSGRAWRRDAEAFAESTRLTVAVLRAGAVTEPTHARCPVCLVPPRRGCADSVPDLACFETGTFGRRPREMSGLCASGMHCALRRLGEGDALDYVVVTGYLPTETQRKDLLARLLGYGLPERQARAVARRLPVMSAAAALASARLAASHVDALVAAAEPARAEEDRLLRFERLYEMGRALGTARPEVAGVPASLLERAISVSGAGAGALYLLEPDGRGLSRTVVTAEGGSAAWLPERCLLGEGPAGRAAAEARGLLLAGDGRGEPSAVAAPLTDDGTVLGAVVLVHMTPDAEDADERDVKLLELFAESAGHALANARRYSEANERVIELMQLNELSRALHADAELDNLTYLVTGVLDKLVDFEVGGLILLGREERGRIVLHADVPESDLAALLGEVTGMALDASFLERCALVTPPDTVAETGWAPGAKWTVLAEDVSTSRPEAGYLFVASRRHGAFDATDARLLRAEAAHASVALEKSRVHARLRGDLDKLVRALSAVLESTKRSSAGHADRVVDHALAIGVELGLSAAELETLRFAGLLHDIGKLGVAEEIVVKAAPLSDEELAEARRHAEIGATLVEQMDFLAGIAPVIMHHHERWDGRGYPAGLSGEEIPTLSRILAVADRFDALAAGRDVGKPLPPATARLEIEREAGAAFDPAVVEAFLAVLDRGVASAALGAFAVDDTRPQLPA
jgi:HD-GYP domain-containing protein (c-di-GMP phosphodiesterase class II)